MHTFKSKISNIIAHFEKSPLPGLSSQLKLAPKSRLVEHAKYSRASESGRASELGSKNAKNSAVLILFYPKENQTHLAMMVRAADKSVHSGQVSFPGGMAEESDESIIHTALREANEELGIIPESVKIIGQLSKLYIPPSNFDVYPIVGYTNSTPIFKTNYEVHKVLEVNLTTLLDPDTLTNKKIPHRTGNEFMVPCYYIQGEIIWGASAMIMSELLEIIK